MILVCLPYSRYLCHLGDASHLLTHVSPDSHSFSWTWRYLSCPSPHLNLKPSHKSNLYSLSFKGPFLHLPLMTILDQLLSEIQTSSFGLFFLFSFFGSVECGMHASVFYGQHPLISEYISCMSFWDSVTSLRMIFSSFIHLPAKFKCFGFKLLNSIPLCRCASLFIHSSVEGDLVYFKFLAITNKPN